MSLRLANIAALLLFAGGSVYAADGYAQIPASVEPVRVQEDIKQRKVLYKVPPPIATESEFSDAPDGSENIWFVVKEIKVDGANTLPKAEIRGLYEAKLGREISVSDLYVISNTITKYYRDRGYLLSRAVIPQQEISEGAVKIAVIEGFIHSYTIQGDISRGDRQLDHFARRIQSARPLNIKELERYLLLMNDLPGISVRSVFTPLPDVVGGVHLDLVVTRKFFSGSMVIDNFGNSYLGPLHLTQSFALNSPFHAGDQWTASFLSAPDNNELCYYSVGVKKFMGGNGASVSASGSWTKTDPSLPPLSGGLLEPKGRASSWTFSYNYPFIRSRQTNMAGLVSFNTSSNATDYAPGLTGIETEDRLRVLRAGLQFSRTDKFMGQSAASFTVSRGLGLLNASKHGDANLSRAQGDPEFTKIAGSVSRYQQIRGPVTLLVDVNGQFSADPLLAAEEYGFGGVEFGRGYDASEITGEHGIGLKTELAYTRTGEGKFFSDHQFYAFYDIGTVWNRDAAAGQDKRESAASAGLGSRASVNDKTRADIWIAKPLTHSIPSRGVDSQDWRLKFQVSVQF